MTTTTDVIEHLARIAENDYSLPDVASDIRDLDTLRQQRDELLAACKAAVPILLDTSVFRVCRENGMHDERAQAANAVRAAIAKCEG